jgi:predicted nucleotidyltransferase
MGAVTLPGVVSEALARFARAVRDRFGSRVSEIVLFGSYARGEAHEDSDVDVLVVVDDLSAVEEREILDIAYAVKQAMDEWVGLVPVVLSTARVAELRAGGRRLWRDIAVEGVTL